MSNLRRSATRLKADLALSARARTRRALSLVLAPGAVRYVPFMCAEREPLSASLEITRDTLASDGEGRHGRRVADARNRGWCVQRGALAGNGTLRGPALHRARRYGHRL